MPVFIANFDDIKSMLTMHVSSCLPTIFFKLIFFLIPKDLFIKNNLLPHVQKYKLSALNKTKMITILSKHYNV